MILAISLIIVLFLAIPTLLRLLILKLVLKDEKRNRGR